MSASGRGLDQRLAALGAAQVGGHAGYAGIGYRLPDGFDGGIDARLGTPGDGDLGAGPG